MINWIVPVSSEESGKGKLLPQSESAAHASLTSNGCVILRGVFSTSTIDALHREYLAQFGAMNARQMTDQAGKPLPNIFLEVGDARFEITPRMVGAFGSPDVFANALLRWLLVPLLGSDMRLSGFTIVASHPGAPLQHPHRDHGHLFAEPEIGPRLPVYAINVAVPLIDVDLETGPTGIWLGSHVWADSVEPRPEDMTACAFQRGDCVLLDYRTMHTGLPNRSRRVRPIIYMVYARTWFFDEVNHAGRAPLNMSVEKFLSLPDSIRPLLLRAFSQAMRERQVRG